MIAETMLGNADRAYQYYARVNPVGKNDQIEKYECEPYVFAQNVLGDEHPQFGLARNSWLSGTASWMYQAFLQYMLGIRPGYDGLEIKPCIPSEWDGFTMKRIFRNCAYAIRVERSLPGEKTEARIFLDGQPFEGSSLPVLDDGLEHHVLVRI